jgi:hypothetical protein
MERRACSTVSEQTRSRLRDRFGQRLGATGGGALADQSEACRQRLASNERGGLLSGRSCVAHDSALCLPRRFALTLRRIVAYLVCLLVVAMLFQIALPAVGIPRAQLLPPPRVYADAKGRTTGRITAKPTSPSANPFHVGTIWYFIEYAFQAPAPAMLGVRRPGARQTYRGSVRVDKGTYDAVKEGGPVPVRYETTYPVINGIDAPNGGRSTGAGSSLFSWWILWALLTLFVAYLLFTLVSPFLKPENI